MPKATWNGPFDALLPNMGTLRVGETYDVTDEDLKSDHWQAADSPAPSFAAPVAAPAKEATS